MFTRSFHVAMATLLLCSLGCASSFVDPTGRITSLEETQRKYTQLVRWGEIKRASMYVEPELREEYLSYAPLFDQIRITDTDTDEVKMDAGEKTADVDVVYHGYSYTTYEEKRIFETQSWTRYEGVKNIWLVRPEIAQIAEAFVGAAN
jgi:hypothetical protein